MQQSVLCSAERCVLPVSFPMDLLYYHRVASRSMLSQKGMAAWSLRTEAFVRDYFTFTYLICGSSVHLFAICCQPCLAARYVVIPERKGCMELENRSVRSRLCHIHSLDVHLSSLQHPLGAILLEQRLKMVKNTSRTMGISEHTHIRSINQPCLIS